MFDTCAFPSTARVKEVGAIGRAAYATWDEARWSELLAAFKLTPKKKVSELSRGMGMKLTLAFALAHHPQLLVLDEATAGLDPLARDEVLDILRDFVAEGDRGILMSTHITSDLEKIADEIVCVDKDVYKRQHRGPAGAGATLGQARAIRFQPMFGRQQDVGHARRGRLPQILADEEVQIHERLPLDVYKRQSRDR